MALPVHLRSTDRGAGARDRGGDLGVRAAARREGDRSVQHGGEAAQGLLGNCQGTERGPVHRRQQGRCALGEGEAEVIGRSPGARRARAAERASRASWCPRARRARQRVIDDLACRRGEHDDHAVSGDRRGPRVRLPAPGAAGTFWSRQVNAISRPSTLRSPGEGVANTASSSRARIGGVPGGPRGIAGRMSSWTRRCSACAASHCRSISSFLGGLASDPNLATRAGPRGAGWSAWERGGS
jgi:hypothetical protein